MRSWTLFLLVAALGVRFLAVIAGPAWGQPGALVEFEVVSIKPTPANNGTGPHFFGCRGGPGSSDPGLIRCSHYSSGNLVPVAYGMGFLRVSYAHLTGGSNWPQFEIIAKVPRGATKEQVKLMWQKLLADRFKLAAHRETKEVPVYELVVAKGGFKGKAWVDPANPPDPFEAGGSSKRDKDGFPIAAPGQHFNFFTGSKGWFVAPAGTMTDLAAVLEARLSINDPSPRPVIDATGLTGKYDLKFWWSPAADSPSADLDHSVGPSMLSAIESQLGLKLQPKKSASVEMLVIDHLDRVPSEN